MNNKNDAIRPYKGYTAIDLTGYEGNSSYNLPAGQAEPPLRVELDRKRKLYVFEGDRHRRHRSQL